MRRLNDGTLEILAPYSAGFVTELKARVPRWARTWHPDRRCWTVEWPHARTAAGVVSMFYRPVSFVDDVQSDIDRTGWPTAMFEDLPPSLHRPVYLALAKVLHPDTGGDLLSAQKLTAAWNILDRRPR